MSFMLQNWARLYTNLTEAEQSLEPAIAALGRRYRAQHPFFGLRLIADFALIDDKIVIEVDGSSHRATAQKQKDLQHMLALEAKGWAVVRCKNEEALQDPHGTLDRLLKSVATRPSPEELRILLGRLGPLPEPKPSRRRRSGRAPARA
jgi:very-short-patch-repair endonuclease